MLKPFKIRPIAFRDGTQTYRGYSIAAFQAVFDRYLGVSVLSRAAIDSVPPPPAGQVEQLEHLEHPAATVLNEGLPDACLKHVAGTQAESL